MAIKHSDGLPEKQIYKYFIHQKLVAHKKTQKKTNLNKLNQHATCLQIS